MEAVFKSQIVSADWNIDSKEFDFFFLATGSDYRAYSSLKIAKENDVNIHNVIVFDFQERAETIKKRKKDGSQQYIEIDYNKQIVNCSIKNPSDALKSLNLNLTSESRVIVDISFFTKPFYFTLLNWLKELYQVNNVSILYTEPKNYIFKKGLYSDYHSSEGPISIEEISSFSGDDSNKEDSLLIIMLGFDGDLSTEIDQSVAPKKTILINGFPSYSPNFKDISLVANERIVNKGGNKLFFGKSTNPFDTYNLLREIKNKEEYKNLFINIAPIGPKPMSVGVCLFALHNPDVRIIYPMPEVFENVTSKEAWSTWNFEISLQN